LDEIYFGTFNFMLTTMPIWLPSKLLSWEWHKCHSGHILEVLWWVLWVHRTVGFGYIKSLSL